MPTREQIEKRALADCFEIFIRRLDPFADDTTRWPFWAASRKAAKSTAMLFMEAKEDILFISIAKNGERTDEYIRLDHPAANGNTWFHKDIERERKKAQEDVA